ncbi:MAG: hypothetical protein FJ128_10585 [Deltaproteobacteria bacterium]|nr:hypothetical protein [Deltaproteobacteria bacterium]
MENHEKNLVSAKSESGDPDVEIPVSASGNIDSMKPKNGQIKSKIIYVAWSVAGILPLLVIIIGIPYSLYIYKCKELSNFYNRIESEWKAKLENHKSKIDYLERRINDLQYDNNKYLMLLQASPQSIPFLNKRITELEEELGKLKSAGLIPTKPKPPAEPNEIYLYFKEMKKGDAFIDPLSGSTLGVSEIFEDNTASIALTLPGQPTKSLIRVLPGTSWNYSYKATNYRITITTIRWLTGNYIVEVREIGK